ncbi:hypothetical protein CDAR_248121 [Caerostris darwini]|uniref:Uncharacterized protein n=1 Tax=Caerostris darwini TaxID=1538125 RepID=A0AAV4TLW8_9ARAC|nr:hypothetical protein CDAR_248121 [Caerostris darwini]
MEVTACRFDIEAASSLQPAWRFDIEVAASLQPAWRFDIEIAASLQPAWRFDIEVAASLQPAWRFDIEVAASLQPAWRFDISRKARNISNVIKNVRIAKLVRRLPGGCRETQTLNGPRPIERFANVSDLNEPFCRTENESDDERREVDDGLFVFV